MDTTRESVRKVGELDHDSIVFGHGSRLVGDVAAAVASLEGS